MRKILLTTTGLAWLALTGVVSAAVTLIPGPMDPQYFAGEPASENGFTIDGATWTALVPGLSQTEKGSVPSEYAAPLGMGTSRTTGTTYMAVMGGGTELVTFATSQTSLAIYWGSIDATASNLNAFAVSVDGFTLTGADLVALGASGDGSQTDPAANQLVIISGLKPTFSSTGSSFEFSLPASTPELSTWAMMMLGFAGLGYAAFRRNSRGRTAVGAI
jgi:hypothetical protein